MMIDCLTWSTRSDGDASRKIQAMREKVAAELRQAYDQLIPPPTQEKP